MGLQLAGKVALITGAARGIGAAMARVFSSEGINVASISGQRGGARRTAYGVSKAGVIQLTRVLAVELAPYRIRAAPVSSPGTC